MKKLHYGWFVLVACCAHTLGGGLTLNVIGQYFVPVTSDLGFGMGQFTFYYAMRGIFMVISLTMLNKWLKMFNLRLLLAACYTIQLICTALMGTFTEIWQWYAAGAVMGFFLPPVYFVIPPIILSNWFVKKRGFVTGLALSFSGVGGVLMNPILARLIQEFGWRTAYWLNAVIAGVVVLPFLIFMIRLHPDEKGVKPYGYEEPKEDAGQGDKQPSVALSDQPTGVPTAVAVRSTSFVFMVLLFSAVGFFSGYPQHLTSYGISIGHSVTFAAYLLSLSMLGNVICKLAFGVISDKFGGMVLIFFALGITMATFLLLLGGVANTPALLAGAFLSGCLFSISSVGTPLMLQSVYGLKDYARLFLLLSISQNFFVSFGPSIVGFMYDHSGGYAFPLMAGVAVTIVAAVLVVFSFRTSKELEWS